MSSIPQVVLAQKVEFLADMATKEEDVQMMCLGRQLSPHARVDPSFKFAYMT